MIKKILLLSLIAIALIGLPLTVFLTQQKQQTQSEASGSTTLYFQPTSTASSPIAKQNGDTVSLDVMVDPGSNAVSILKLHLHYDPTKFQAVNQNPFTVNQSTFSTIIEGPINDLNNGNIYISVSIGSDTTKAIRNAPARVGTLQLKAIQPTSNEPTTVSFGSVSAAYSVAVTDQASQNVLATTTPAYLTIGSVSTITSQPSATSTPAPSATSTPIPTLLPTTTSIPSATPTGEQQETRFALTIFLHSIGASGDNANPNSTLSNKNPLRPTRTVFVSIYNASNQLVTTKPATVSYDTQTGNFKGIVSLGNNLAADNYIVKVKTDSFLQRRVGIVSLVPLTQMNLPATTLVTGDDNNDNVINILDYNVLIGCYSDLLPATSCDTNKKLMTDFNDDGNVNQFDYNLFLREIAVQNGD